MINKKKGTHIYRNTHYHLHQVESIWFSDQEPILSVRCWRWAKERQKETFKFKWINNFDNACKIKKNRNWQKRHNETSENTRITHFRNTSVWIFHIFMLFLCWFFFSLLSTYINTWSCKPRYITKSIWLLTCSEHVTNFNGVKILRIQ